MIGTRGAGGQIGGTPSGPVIATLCTGITARQRSTNVSSVAVHCTGSGVAHVAGSISLTLGGNGIVTRTSPFSTRFEKSVALSPLTRKSSASTGRKSGSSAFLLLDNFASSASKRARAIAGESWNASDGTWQSAHARPLPPSLPGLRSLKATRPRATASHGWLSQLSRVVPFPCAMTCPAPVRESTAATRHTPAAIPVNHMPVFTHRVAMTNKASWWRQSANIRENTHEYRRDAEHHRTVGRVGSW